MNRVPKTPSDHFFCRSSLFQSSTCPRSIPRRAPRRRGWGTRLLDRCWVGVVRVDLRRVDRRIGVMGDSGRGFPNASTSHDLLSEYESTVLVRVVTTNARRDTSKSVPLRDVFDDKRWSEAVDNSPLANHFLSTITYDEFAHHPKSRLLSYRADQVVKFDCAVNDPGRLIPSVSNARVPLSCLGTPQTKGGWTHLWIDVLHHLGDPQTIQDSYHVNEHLCLQVTIIPQAWLTKDPDTVHRAFSRAWVCREITFGRVDRDALDLFFEMCVEEHAAQTNGEVWDGEPDELKGPRLLARLIGRRPRAASSEEASDPDVAVASLEWWQRVHNANIQKEKTQTARRYTLNSDAAQKAAEKINAIDETKEDDTKKLIIIAQDASRDDTDDECELQLKELMYNLSARQLSDDPKINAMNLEKDPSLAWHVICAYASDALYEVTDAYFCSLGVIALACGFPSVEDPLGHWKQKFIANKRDMPRDENNQLSFRVEDVDVSILDKNHETLRKAWQCLAPRASWEGIPECLRGVVFADHARVDWSTRPPGTATLGLGPVPATLMTRGGIAPIGPFFGFDFSRAPNGHRKIGELRGGYGTGRAASSRGAGDVVGADGVSFPEHTKGVLVPKTYQEEVDVNVSRMSSGQLDVNKIFDADTESDLDEESDSFQADTSNPWDTAKGGMRVEGRTSSAPVSSTGSATLSPSMTAQQRTTSSGMSLRGLTGFAGLSLTGSAFSGMSFVSSKPSGSGQSSVAGSDFGDTDDETDTSRHPSIDENSAVDGLATTMGPSYFGYHVASSWNKNKASKRVRRSKSGRELAGSEEDELESTLKNLWRAWLFKYDLDGSGTISMDELTAFAEKETCPSSDSYMTQFHEWARSAYEQNNLDAQFKRVDIDGSGELEYPEFRAMLLTE